MPSNKKVVGLVVSVVLLIVGFVIFQVYLALTFRITKTTPKLKGVVTTALQTFVVEFNKELDPDVDYLKNLDDNLKHVAAVKIKGKNLEVRTKPAIDGKQYSFTVKNIKAKNGSVISAVNFNYTARYIPYEQLPKDQRQLIDQQKDQPAEDNPILNHLPYGDLHYSLSAEFEEHEEESVELGKLRLKAEILLSASDVRTDKDSAIAIYKQEVLDYIKSLGFDPAKFEIIYEIIEPSLY